MHYLLLKNVRFVKSIKHCHFSNYKRFYESVDGYVRNSLIVGEKRCIFLCFSSKLVALGLVISEVEFFCKF